MLIDFLETECSSAQMAEAFAAPIRYWQRHGGAPPLSVCGNAFCVSLDGHQVIIECLWDDEPTPYVCSVDEYLSAIEQYCMTTR
ncbi:hypothetical protein L1281_002214 [Neisseria sp. HSC-16F19]|nr:hypothetical protein [Neisseria sp. HSC-16F19]MCP2041605.1 hypothetical protein [Neisseria sp. HSC-16F19]